MSVELNKKVMDQFTKFINSADEKLAEEVIATDAVFWVPGQPEPLKGLAGYMRILGMMRGGFSDVQWTLEETIAEGDNIAARFTMRGTHDGAFFGVPASGKKIEVRAMNFYRFADGKIVEEYGHPDLLGLLQQIGAMPRP
jgi:steroid delta-isomerase-like uncharacterized protein